MFVPVIESLTRRGIINRFRSSFERKVTRCEICGCDPGYCNAFQHARQIRDHDGDYILFVISCTSAYCMARAFATASGKREPT